MLLNDYASCTIGDIGIEFLMGTSAKFKKHWCSKCFKNVDKMTREQQDLHEIECAKQTKLF